MRIAFVSQYFFPEQFSNNAIAVDMVNRGHDVTVLTAVPNYPRGIFFEGYSNREKRSESWSGVHIDRVWTIARGSKKLTLMANYLTFSITGSIKAMFGRGPKPDVVFVSQLSPILMCLPGIMMARRHGVPLVYWVQDIWPESATHTLGIRNSHVVSLMKKVCGWIYRKADVVLVQSRALPPMIARFGVPEDDIDVLPNTAPDVFRPMSVEDASDVTDHLPTALMSNGLNIFFAGNIGESQDFDTYIAAAEILKAEGTDVNWIVIGSGRDKDRVEAEINKRGLQDNFCFLGRFPEEDMPKFFAHADAMLVGLKDNDIFRLTVPFKVQCYMACGRPIIGSLNGLGGEIIREAKAGCTAPAETPKALAGEIALLAKASTADRATMGANARRYFEENFHRDKVFGDLEKFLLDVIAKKKS